MFNLNLRFFQKTYVGISLSPPYCHLIGIRITKDFNFILVLKEKILIQDFYQQPSSIYIGSLPLSLLSLDVFPFPTPQKSLSFYLGLKKETPCWMHAHIEHTRLEEYVLRHDKIPLRFHILEVDAIAIWHYAYWCLKKLNAYHQVILWIYQHSHGYYLLLGRNEMLWVMHDLDSLDLLETWIRLLSWPKPSLVISVNVLAEMKTLDIPVMYFNIEEESWVLTWALAIRGAYAAI
jgi:hypothetical protein